MNQKMQRMKSELLKAKYLLIEACKKEEMLNDNYKRLSEINFGLKKALKFFESYFYFNVEKLNGKLTQKEKAISTPSSLTDIWAIYQQKQQQCNALMKSQYFNNHFLGNGQYNTFGSKIDKNYEIFGSIKFENGFGWTPFESPKGFMMPELFTKDSNIGGAIAKPNEYFPNNIRDKEDKHVHVSV